MKWISAPNKCFEVCRITEEGKEVIKHKSCPFYCSDDRCEWCNLYDGSISLEYRRVKPAFCKLELVIILEKGDLADS